MSRIQRIHCHSAFKHYEMFHCNNDSGYNSIFNVTYNFNGGGMFGGGFWGGLWGGLGMGLGAGLMNLLGFGGGNMYGGNMFGGGFGMCMPFANNWGMGGVRNADGAGGKNSNGSDKADCDDPDRKTILELSKKIEALKKNENITQDDIDALRDEITGAKDDSDDNHKKADDDSYDDLLSRLENIKPKSAPKAIEGTDDDSGVSRVSGDGKSKVTSGSDPVSALDKTDGSSSPATVKEGDDGKKQIVLRMATSNADKLIDHKIEGTIKGVALDSEGKIKYYVIDCDTTDSKFKLRYKVTRKTKRNANGKEITYFNVKCISNIHHCDEYQKLYKKNDGVDYEVDGDKLVNNTNDKVVSVNEKDGYTKINYTKGEQNKETDYDANELDIDFKPTNEIDEEKFDVIIKQLTS